MTQIVVSGPEMRLFAGMGFGAANARMFVMVVFDDEFRFTRPESASVPVLTDHRSTPHWAARWFAETRTRAATRRMERRKRSIIFSPFTKLRLRQRDKINPACD